MQFVFLDYRQRDVGGGADVGGRADVGDGADVGGHDVGDVDANGGDDPQIRLPGRFVCFRLVVCFSFPYRVRSLRQLAGALAKEIHSLRRIETGN